MSTTRHRVEATAIAAVCVIAGFVAMPGHRDRRVPPTFNDAVHAGLVAQESPAPPCAVSTPAHMGQCGPLAAYAALNTTATLTSAPLASDPHGLLGPDVSSYEPNVNWRAARRHIAFAFVKAGEGQSWTDPTFPRNWRELRALHIPHSAYYFIRPSPDHSAVFEATRFVRIVVAHGGFDSLPPVIDAEASSGLGNGALHHWIVVFARRVQALTHRGQIIVYTGAWFWNPQVGGAHVGLLWVSGYAPRPAVPASWSSYVLWQFTDGQYGPTPRSLPGVGHADISIFHGSRSQLARLAGVEPRAHIPATRRPPHPAKRRPHVQSGAQRRRAVLRELRHRHCRRPGRRYRHACRVWARELR